MSVAQRLRQKLLDLAIHGKLVPQDPKDGPAGELLARIRKARVQLLSAKGIRKEDWIIPVDDDEIPFELPKEWTWCRFRELGILTGGHTPSMANPKFWNGDVLWVTSKDMKRKYIEDTGAKITALGAGELTMLEPGAVLMCTRSGILRRTFPVAIAAKELTINQDQRALTMALPEMAEYVYSALCALEPLILSEYRKTGTTVESIIWEKFIDMPFPLPPLAEQKRIVEKLNAMLKESTRVAEGMERLAQLRKKARAKILDLAIRGKLVKQEKSDEPATVLLKRIRTSREGSASLPDEPFELPQGWVWCRLGEIFDMHAGKHISANEISSAQTDSYPYPCYGGNGVRGYVSHYNAEGPLAIVGRQGALCGNVQVACGCFYATEHAVVVDSTGGMDADFVGLFLTALNLNQYATATAQPGLSVAKICEEVLFPLPPLAEQRRIVAKVREMLATCDALGGEG